MNKYFITEQAEGGYWKAVQIVHVPDDYYKLDKLPFVLVHPSFKVKAGDWIENYIQGYETKNDIGDWVSCTKEKYDSFTGYLHERYRPALLPMVEKKEDFPTPSNPPSIIGEEEFACMFNDEEVIAAKQTRDIIVKAGLPEEKAIYMAGEIAMWDELRTKLSASLPPNKEQEGGLRWVKASERLPEKVGEQYYLKIVNDKGYKFKIIGVFMWKNRKREQRNFYNVGINWYKNELTNVTEWLEELPPTPDTSK